MKMSKIKKKFYEQLKNILDNKTYYIIIVIILTDLKKELAIN